MSQALGVARHNQLSQPFDGAAQFRGRRVVRGIGLFGSLFISQQVTSCLHSIGANLSHPPCVSRVPPDEPQLVQLLLQPSQAH